MKTILTSALALVLTAGLAARQTTPAKTDTVAGKWIVSTQAQNQSYSSTLDIKLDGKKVTGTMESQMGVSAITGEFADGKLTFSMSFSGQQGQMQITYVATLKAGKLSGTLNTGQMELPWTAERAPDQQPAKPPAPSASTITGTWTMNMVTSSFNASPTLVFKQDGEKITGTYTGRYGVSPLQGTLKDGKLQFVATIDAEGTATKMTFWGEVAADGQSITKGTAEIDGLGDVTWTATRAK